MSIEVTLKALDSANMAVYSLTTVDIYKDKSWIPAELTINALLEEEIYTKVTFTFHSLQQLKKITAIFSIPVFPAIILCLYHFSYYPVHLGSPQMKMYMCQGISASHERFFQTITQSFLSNVNTWAGFTIFQNKSDMAAFGVSLAAHQLIARMSLQFIFDPNDTLNIYGNIKSLCLHNRRGTLCGACVQCLVHTKAYIVAVDGYGLSLSI